MSKLDKLADEYSLAVSRERTASQQIEWTFTAVREARQALFLEAVRVLVADPSKLQEVATVLEYDTGAAGLDAVAQHLGSALTTWVRDEWRKQVGTGF